MKKIIITSLVTFIIGLIIGSFLTIFFYPFFFPPPEVNEQVSNVSQKTIIADGTFIHPNPRDRVHWGRGNVTIYKSNQSYEVFLNKNFEVGPGPNFHVYLSESSNVKTKSDFKNAKNYDLGALKSFRGSQVYNVPQDVDFKKIKSVVVWCVTFSQLITSANLNKKNS